MAARPPSTSVEITLLRESWDEIHGLIKGSIINLSIKATSVSLLTDEEQENCTHQLLTGSDQANRFMQYISNKVKNDPSTLKVFITNVLGKEPAFLKFTQQFLAKLNNAQETNAEETLRAPVQESGSTETGEQDASGSGFTESMDTNALIVWLRSKGIPNSDVAILQEQQVSGDCFMNLSEGEMKDLKLSFGGRTSVKKLQNTIRGGAVKVTLEIKHLRFLVNNTWDARNKWTHIGRQLGIDQSSLDSIASSKLGKAEDCYPEMLSTWLRRDGATWGTLLEVLESPVVDQAIVAGRVKNLSDEKKQIIGYF